MGSLKKLSVSVIAAGVVGALLTGTVVAPAQAAAKKKIAFVMGAESDPFFQAMKVGAVAAAAANNVELIWQGDPTYVYAVTPQVKVKS